MKIAFLVNEFPSVSQTFIQNQIIGVIEAGHEVTIFAGNARKDLVLPEDLQRYQLLERTKYPVIPAEKIPRVVQALQLAGKGMLKHPLPVLKSLNVFKYGRSAASFSLLYSIMPFLEQDSYDLVHCQFGTLGLQGLALKQMLGGKPKLVTSFRGFDATMEIYTRPGLYKELFKEGDLFLPVSHSLKQRIMDQGCPEQKIVVLPSGINCEKITQSGREKFTNAGRVLAGEPVKVLSIGRLVEKKGFAYAIDAVARLIASGRNLTYEIAGDGPLRESLEQSIAAQGMQARIRLLGRKNHEEVFQLLESAQIFLAPSVTAADGDQEGIPNVLKEAMAMTLPVICTKHSGIPELVEEGVSGFLVDERDSGALAERLGYMLDHPDKWEQMGKAGLACVETRYNIKALNARLLELYGQLCTAS